MATTSTLWASGTPTTTGSTWTNVANAAGTNNAGFATFTTATSGAAGVINMAGYGAQTAIGATPTSVDSLAVRVYFYVATVARWTSVTVGVYDGGTIVGSAQTATLTTTTTNSQLFTFTGVSWANLANLTIRATGTKSGTTSSTFNVDAASVVVTYTPAGAALTDSPADPVGISDSVTAAADYDRTAADPVGITDSVTAVLSGGSAYSDDFNRADGAPGSPWSVVSGSWSIASNALTVSAGSGNIIVYGTALASADHYVEATFATAPASSMALFARSNLAGSTFYMFRNDGSTSQLFRNVAGSFTGLGSTIAGALSAGDVVRLEVSGSTITAYVNGVVKVSLTDTTITTGTYGGFRGNAGQVWDNFSEGPLGSAPVTFSPADPVGITDAVSTVVTADRTPADPVGITDSATRTVDAVRTAADPVGVTDSVTSSTGLNRTAADPVGLTDSASVSWEQDRTPADAVGITDSVTATFTGTGSADLADPVGATDAATGTAQRDRQTGDPVGATDSLTVAAQRDRTTADPVGVTDALTVAWQRVATVDDFLALTDTATPSQSSDAGNSLADPVGITDATTASSGRTRAPADPVGITDSVVAVMQRVATIADAVGILDAAANTSLFRDIEGTFVLDPDRARFTLDADRARASLDPDRATARLMPDRATFTLEDD